MLPNPKEFVALQVANTANATGKPQPNSNASNQPETSVRPEHPPPSLTSTRPREKVTSPTPQEMQHHSRYSANDAPSTSLVHGSHRLARVSSGEGHPRPHVPCTRHSTSFVPQEQGCHPSGPDAVWCVWPVLRPCTFHHTRSEMQECEAREGAFYRTRDMGGCDALANIMLRTACEPRPPCQHPALSHNLRLTISAAHKVRGRNRVQGRRIPRSIIAHDKICS
jgi:hypothetical protein